MGATLADQGVCWSSDPSGKIDQLRSQVKNDLEPKGRRYINLFEEKRVAIAALEAENHQQIIDSAKIAYDSLESVVDALLLIEKGQRTLSRQSETIVAALDSTTTKFADLSKVSEENMEELGVKAGDCMELGDSSGSFIRDLQEEIDGLNALVPHVFELKKSHDTTLQDKRDREHTLQWQLSEAESSVSDFGNVFIGFFDNSVIRNAEQRVRDARRNLDENREQQERAKSASQRFYELAITVRNASAALFGLKMMVQDISNKFDVKYKAVTDAQDVENRLCRGLLQLRNQIVSGDWTTTRDKSLQVVLSLLAADDTVLKSQECEDTEVRIKKAITAKMGDGSVQNLIDAVAMDKEIDSAASY